MQVLLFSIVAMCIAGSRTQEIAIGTEYLRAFPSEPGINSQIIELPQAESIAINPASPTSSTDATTTTAVPKIDDHNSPEHDDHDTKISVDVHSILDFFKQELHKSEERVLAAIQHSQPSIPVPALQSYRTADR